MGVDEYPGASRQDPREGTKRGKVGPVSAEAEMASCKFCGEGITWRDERTGWVPLDSYGRDHRETCRGVSVYTRRSAANNNHEQRVREFLRPRSNVVRKAATQPSKPRATHGWCTHVYAGIVPPWDDSLGMFRDFTPIEKQQGAVCTEI